MKVQTKLAMVMLRLKQSQSTTLVKPIFLNACMFFMHVLLFSSCFFLVANHLASLLSISVYPFLPPSFQSTNKHIHYSNGKEQSQKARPFQDVFDIKDDNNRQAYSAITTNTKTHLYQPHFL